MSLDAAFRRRKKVRYNMYARPHMLCEVHAKKNTGAVVGDHAEVLC